MKTCDFDITNKSLEGFVTIKAKSLDDLNQLQIDLAETLNINKVIYKNQELSFSRELDAVLITFPSVILENNLFEFTVYYNGIPQNADNPPWAGGFTWSKDKNGRDWVAVSCEGEGIEDSGTKEGTKEGTRESTQNECGS